MYALLIDTVGIQKYIFQSNHLQENLGASFIVKTLFNDFFKEQGISSQGNVTIGGGHCLVTNLSSEEEVKNIIKDLSTDTLKKYPGLTLSFAYIDDFDEKRFKDSIDKLYGQLRNNRSAYVIHNIVPHSGITAECKRSGYSANHYYGEDKDYISDVSYVKLGKAKSANEFFQKKLLDEPNYVFPNTFDKLGQSEGDSHIAIVHIDGNRMGAILEKIENLKTYQEFSQSASKATKQSFKQLVRHITQNYEVFQKILPNLKDKTLPIRPIVVGGDDITFVSEAHVSFYLTEKLLKYFKQNFKAVVENNEDLQKIIGQGITASAGIMIMGTKYPFYRGYMAAEELTSIAKNRYKEESPKSFLSFDVAYSGFFSIEEPKRKEDNQGKEEKQEKQEKQEKGEFGYELNEFKELKENLFFLKKKWPHNKIKELRRVLDSGDEELKMFISELKARRLPLPENFSANDFPKKVYQDIVDIIDLYPTELSKELKEESHEVAN